MGYLIYESAKSSAVYINMAKVATDRLMKVGAFARGDILDVCQMQVFADAIRWQYVVRMIEEQERVTLIPLAASYFKRHKREEEERFPQRFAATGHGKKTVGYALATLENGHFIVHRLEQRTKITNGMIKSTNRTVELAKKTGVKIVAEAHELLPEPKRPDPQLAGPEGSPPAEEQAA